MIIKREIDKRLNFCETVQLIKIAIHAEVLITAPNDDSKILVYIDNSKDVYSIPILDAGQNLMNDLLSQKMLKEKIQEKGFDATLYNKLSFEPIIQKIETIVEEEK